MNNLQVIGFGLVMSMALICMIQGVPVVPDKLVENATHSPVNVDVGSDKVDVPAGMHLMPDGHIMEGTIHKDEQDLDLEENVDKMEEGKGVEEGHLENGTNSDSLDGIHDRELGSGVDELLGEVNGTTIAPGEEIPEVVINGLEQDGQEAITMETEDFEKRGHHRFPALNALSHHLIEQNKILKRMTEIDVIQLPLQELEVFAEKLHADLHTAMLKEMDEAAVPEKLQENVEQSSTSENFRF